MIEFEQFMNNVLAFVLSIPSILINIWNWALTHPTLLGIFFILLIVTVIIMFVMLQGNYGATSPKFIKWALILTVILIISYLIIANGGDLINLINGT